MKTPLRVHAAILDTMRRSGQASRFPVPYPQLSHFLRWWNDWLHWFRYWLGTSIVLVGGHAPSVDLGDWPG